MIALPIDDIEKGTGTGTSLDVMLRKRFKLNSLINLHVLWLGKHLNLKAQMKCAQLCSRAMPE